MVSTIACNYKNVLPPSFCWKFIVDLKAKRYKRIIFPLCRYFFSGHTSLFKGDMCHDVIKYNENVDRIDKKQ